MFVFVTLAPSKLVDAPPTMCMYEGHVIRGTLFSRGPRKRDNELYTLGRHESSCGLWKGLGQSV